LDVKDEFLSRKFQRKRNQIDTLLLASLRGLNDMFFLSYFDKGKEINWRCSNDKIMSVIGIYGERN